MKRTRRVESGVSRAKPKEAAWRVQSGSPLSPLRPRRRRSGFVLVMALILIATAAVMLVGMARQSLLLAMEAIDAQEAIQRRWAIISAESVVLSQAPQLFDTTERKLVESGVDFDVFPTSLVADFTLGGELFELILSDEDAKLNLNTYYRRREKQRTAATIREMAGLESQLSVHLRPYRVSRNTPLLPAFDSWGQIFPLDERKSESSVGSQLALATQQLTCWGSGQLNIRRATDESIEELCRLAVTGSAIQQLLAARRETPELSLRTALPQLELRETELRALEELLTDETTCYSIWVHTGSERRHSSLTVAHFIDGNQSLTSSFAW